jgi:hypothetical protein
MTACVFGMTLGFFITLTVTAATSGCSVKMRWEIFSASVSTKALCPVSASRLTLSSTA